MVGKGPDSEPVIPFDTLLAMTAASEVNGVKFDGIDVGLLAPHFNLDDPDEPKRLADKVAKHQLKVGSLVAPIWAGSAMIFLSLMINLFFGIKKIKSKQIKSS